MSKNIKNEVNILYGIEAIKSFVSAVHKMSMAVSKTLGPAGAFVMIDQGYNKVRVTKDGVTVAKALNSNDKFENMAIQLIKEVCIKANTLVGDSTTTSITILSAIIEEGYQRISAKFPPKQLLAGMDKAYKIIEKIIHEMSTEPSSQDLKHVATISADNDHILGSLIHEAVQKVNGKYGMITVEESKSTETELEFTEGMKINKGFISPYFVNQQSNGNIEHEDVVILMTNGKINNQEFTLKFLEHLTIVGKAGLIICDDIDKNILGMLILNNYKGIIKIAAVKAPGFGEERMDSLMDIALFTGGQVIDSDALNAFKIFNPEYLGSCRRIIVSKETTSLINGYGNKQEIENKIEQLKSILDDKNNELSNFEIDKVRESFSQFTGGVAIIKVGGSTESELSEKKDRVIDSVSAVKSAYENGIVVGGGLCSFNAAKIFDERNEISKFDEKEKEGAKILIQALKAPMKQILINGNFDHSVIMNKIFESKSLTIGFDALQGEICDLKERGILDSAKAILTSINVAVSIGKMALNSQVCISNSEKEEQ